MDKAGKDGDETVKGYLTFADGVNESLKLKSFELGFENPKINNFDTYLVIGVGVGHWGPIEAKEAVSIGLRAEEVCQPENYWLFYFTRQRHATSIAEVEVPDANLNWHITRQAGWSQGAYGVPAVNFRMESIREFVREYKSPYDRIAALCDRFRRRGFVALVRVSDHRDPAGSARYNDQVFPIKLAEELRIEECGFDKGQAKTLEFEYICTGGADKRRYIYRGLDAQVVPLYRGSEPYVPVKQLRYWKFSRTQGKPSGLVAQLSGKPIEIGLSASALSMIIDLERPGIESHHTRCCQAIGVTRHSYLDDILEAVLKNKDSAEGYKRFAALHTLLGNLTLELPEGSQIRLDDLDSELAEKYHIPVEQLNRLIDFAPQPAEGCLPWEAASDIELPELPPSVTYYNREYSRYWVTNGLRDLRDSLSWRPRVRKERRTILSVRQILRLMEGDWGGVGHSGDFLRHEVVPRLAFHFMEGDNHEVLSLFSKAAQEINKVVMQGQEACVNISGGQAKLAGRWTQESFENSYWKVALEIISETEIEIRVRRPRIGE